MLMKKLAATSSIEYRSEVNLISSPRQFRIIHIQTVGSFDVVNLDIETLVSFNSTIPIDHFQGLKRVNHTQLNSALHSSGKKDREVLVFVARFSVEGTIAFGFIVILEGD